MVDRENNLEKIINFISETEKLKDVHRSGYTSGGKSESTAEHTWRLALMVLMLREEFPACDPYKMLAMSLIHDLGELDYGDIPAIEQHEQSIKEKEEEATLTRLADILPENNGHWIHALWEEYEIGTSPEAKVVKALDKMETILQHNQGDNPKDFNYAFNLDYGKTLAEGHSSLERLRAIVDRQTQDRINDLQ